MSNHVRSAVVVAAASVLVACSSGDGSGASDASLDVNDYFDANLFDVHYDAPADGRDSGSKPACSDYGFVASGTGSCPSSGCTAVTCTCPGATPRSITACKPEGCIVLVNCTAVCAAPSLGDALACLSAYTVEGDAGKKDAGGDGDACTPKTCGDLGYDCGTVDDGCGKSLDCGTCVAPQTCGGAGTAHVCGCTKTTCAAEGAECGTIDDKCGATIDCGGCSSPSWCGAVAANKCGCVPSGTAGPRDPTTGANVVGVGTRAWDTPAYVAGSDDARATISAMISLEQSNYLVAKGFGFSIPPAATITGIEVTVEHASYEGGIVDNQIRIVKGASIGTADRSSTTPWTAGGGALGGPDGFQSYGSPTDLWGTTWTPADVNSPDFGLAISARYTSSAGNDWAFVDNVRITVHFTVACP